MACYVSRLVDIFFTDVVFAGVFMYLVVWGVHRLIYRRTTSRMGEDEVEGALARVGTAMRKRLRPPKPHEAASAPQR
jgi:hypothetical protein